MASSIIQLGIGLETKLGSELTLNDKILKPLDQALRCHICFEYFENCMITKCSHNYCSLCIRRYMAYKAQCPTCFQAATEPELRNNRLVDEVLRIYKKIKETLQLPYETQENLHSDAPSSSRTDGSYESKRPSKIDTSQSRTPKEAETSTFDEVSCPVCYTPIPSQIINSHLDSCLKQSEERSERKFLPKLVYHLLGDKQIRKKLKDHGLGTVGDRQTLIRRHKNYVLLHNANCDSLNPKPPSDLIYEIERQELEERLNAAPRIPPVGKRSDPSVIDKQNESYAQEHKSQFHALMQDVQHREICKAIIKKEDDVSGAFMTSKGDHSGTKIGETSLQLGMAADQDAVNIKREVSDSPQSSQSNDESSDSDEIGGGNTVLAEKKPNASKQPSSRPLPFRIKKEVPVKLKGNSPSLLDMSDDSSTTDSLSSLEDFRVSKMKSRSCLKKKNVRKLSVGDGNHSQRKK